MTFPPSGFDTTCFYPVKICPFNSKKFVKVLKNNKSFQCNLEQFQVIKQKKKTSKMDLNLTDIENTYFNDLFCICDSEKLGKITYLKSLELFRSTNISNDDLLEVIKRN